MSSTAIPATELRAREKLYAPRRHDRFVAALSALCAAVLVRAATLRDEHLISPERGLGYALGILGLAAALALLSYSIRKRFVAAGRWGPMRGWFRLHIALGIIAPTAIVLHGNFQLGSPNSTVALACMLAVVVSGVIGRFVYARIHRGLFGRRRVFGDLQAELRDAWLRVRGPAREDPEVIRALAAFARWATDPTSGLRPSALRFATVGWKARRLEGSVCRALTTRGVRDGRFDEAVAGYLSAAVRIARFRAFERVFALWHALHVPLCILMFATSAVHVVAVHLY